MKKPIIIILIITFSLLASACAAMDTSEWLNDPGAVAYAPPLMYSQYHSGDTSTGYSFTSSADTPEGASLSSAGSSGFAEKIIYTARAEIETLEFDETIDRIHEMLEINGAFIESSQITGIDHERRQYKISSFRSASFTLRVPQDCFMAMTDSLDYLGNVIYTESNAKNITAEFTDVEAHLTALRVQEASLLNMLRAADTVADMIIIEERLSDVRHTIESRTSTLRNWQNQIDYSTLTLNIHEVILLTDTEVVLETDARSYWQQMGDGFVRNARGVGSFFAALFKGLVESLPVLIILGAIVVVVIIFIRRSIKKSAANRMLLYNRTQQGQYTPDHPPQNTTSTPEQGTANQHSQDEDNQNE